MSTLEAHYNDPKTPLGDFRAFMWQPICPYLPQDLSGCNAGFYCFELARRGETVLGIDIDSHYLEQAK